MWTLLPKEYTSEYEQKYRLFEKYPEREYILYSNNTHHLLPRYFHINYPYDKLIIHIDKQFIAREIENVEFTSSLREHQIPIVDTFINKYIDQGYVNGLLNAYPSCGKTCISIYLACKFKRKTLIVVDNQKLKDQFIESIVKFTNLTIDDIGFIQGSKFDSDKPITITMVQTLLSKLKRNLKDFYIKIRDCGFDFVIYDEVHKTSAGPKYAMSTLFINSKNIIGLSATPYVRDVHALLLFNTIGDIIHTSKAYECTPNIVYVTYNSKIDQKIKNKSHYMRDYIRLQAFYNSVIYNNTQYLEVIYKLAKKCLDRGHVTIILVSTVKQIESIIEYLASRDISAEPLYSKKPDVDKVNSTILVGTFKFCSTGFDFKELSALILASPYKGKISLVQSIGRILRTSTGKKQPVVFDLMDTQFPSLFESNITGKNKIFSDEFKGCEIRNVNMD